jgi:putative colanic acid biosynthesis acetyltransferase WcaF
MWYLVKVMFFLSSWPWPSRLKAFWLRLFAARVGQGVVIKPRVNIHLPWKLEIGDHCWLGEEVYILNLETVRLGNHVCLSQRAFLCTGNHDYRREDFAYCNAPIQVGDGAWVGAQAFVGPGVEIGTEAVILAGSIVTQNIPSAKVCGGNPATERRDRWPKLP